MHTAVRTPRARATLAWFGAAVLALALWIAVIAPAPARSTAATPTHATPTHATPTHRTAPTAKQAAFHDGMRKLWEDHIAWTCLAIVSFAGGLPDFDATAQRLLRNQADIGNAIKPYYGARAATQLTALLRTHILGAVDLLKAAKSGDPAALAAAKQAWYANGDDIARFLNRANPRNWRLATMRSAMRMHLDQTLAEASARLSGDFAADIAAYDEVHHHILVMADALSAGIMKQFPGRFR
jgi:hypothetical protein